MVVLVGVVGVAGQWISIELKHCGGGAKNQIMPVEVKQHQSNHSAIQVNAYAIALKEFQTT